MALRAANTFCWTGATSGVFNLTANWKLSDGNDPAAGDLPGWDNDEGGGTVVPGDTIMYDRVPTTAALGYDATALGDFAAIRVTKFYTGDLGQTGTYLTFDMQAAGAVYIDAQAAGDIFIAGGATGLYNVTVIGTKAGSTCYLGGLTTNLTPLKGTVTIIATATIAGTFYIGHLTNQGADVVLTITAGATLPATIYCNGGVVINNVAVTTLYRLGGEWTQKGAMTTLNSYGGNTIWDSGTITKANVYGGKLDASQSVHPRVLTDGDVYPGATIDLDDGLRTVTCTNAIHNYGGTLITAPGTHLTVA